MTEVAKQEEIVLPTFLRGKAAIDKVATPVAAVASPASAKKPVKATKLKAVDPKHAEPSKPKILIFGKPGVGKTWTSLDFPSVYYIDTEGGADLAHYTDKLKKSGGVYLGPEQGSTDFTTIIEQVQALSTEEHNYKTLVIDSISNLMGIEIANELDRLNKAGKKIEFSVEKKPAVAAMRRLTNWLKRIDMSVILVCHEKAEWKNGEQVGETFDGWDKLGHELHLCLNIIKAGDSRKARVTKTRLTGFPDASVFEWSYAAFAERYGKDVIEKKAQAIVLASSEQLTDLCNLIASVRLPEGQEDKWFKAAGVESYAEMEASKIDALIGYVRKLIPTATKGAE